MLSATTGNAICFTFQGKVIDCVSMFFGFTTPFPPTPRKADGGECRPLAARILPYWEPTRQKAFRLTPMICLSRCGPSPKEAWIPGA